MAILPLAVFAFVVVVEIQGQGSRHVILSCGNDDTAQKGEPGFPGKRGPSGERGLQGPVGPKGGVGQCDPTCRTEYNQLNERMQRLERYVEEFNPRNGQRMEVYCDQTTDNGGWLQNTFRYKGLENLHALTSNGSYELRVELEDCENDRRYAKYSSFAIGSGEQQYRLTVSGYSENAGDSLSYHNGRRFTTYDSDHDTSSGNCAVSCHGAWWYGGCYNSNLNGEYLNCQTNTDRAASWFHFRGFYYSLKFIEMKFRPI
ncbi:fibrinogen C domain-containing protein 1-like [Ciona intestinalis]